MKLILGGGLSGLSANYYLLRRNPKESIKLIEGSNHVGGWIKSTINEDKVLFEQAARTIRPRGIPGENTLQLLEELNLNSAVKSISRYHQAAKNRLIYADKELHLLPASLGALFKTQKPFSKPLILQLLKDVYTKSEKQFDNDESIYNFTKRRFGNEMADYLISPMICGICAGNSKEISVRFLLDALFEKEQQYGSISRGLFRDLFKKNPQGEKIESNLLKRAKEEKWNVYYLQEGLEMLPKKLFEQTKNQTQFCLNSKCTNISFGKEVTLKLANGESLHANHLISSVSAAQLSKLVTDRPELAKLLAKIENVSLAVVNLQYNQSNLIRNPGFGFLVCPKENLPILGVIYDSCCFDYNDKTVLTVMMGGHWFNKYFSKETKEEEFLETAVKYVEEILNISSKPDKFKVNVLLNAIPQYKVGHKQLVENIENYIRENQLNLSICGSSYYGIGINDVIWSAKKVVENLKNI